MSAKAVGCSSVARCESSIFRLKVLLITVIRSTCARVAQWQRPLVVESWKMAFLPFSGSSGSMSLDHGGTAAYCSSDALRGSLSTYCDSEVPALAQAFRSWAFCSNMAAFLTLRELYKQPELMVTCPAHHTSSPEVPGILALFCHRHMSTLVGIVGHNIFGPAFAFKSDLDLSVTSASDSCRTAVASWRAADVATIALLCSCIQRGHGPPSPAFQLVKIEESVGGTESQAFPPQFVTLAGLILQV